ncbi:MAG: hypothetical protein ACHQT8_07110 [Chlamydiales bacterium]
MSSIGKLISSVVIPDGQGFRKRDFKNATNDLLKALHLPLTKEHTLNIVRVHGNRLALAFDRG